MFEQLNRGASFSSTEAGRSAASALSQGIYLPDEAKYQQEQRQSDFVWDYFFLTIAHELNPHSDVSCEGDFWCGRQKMNICGQ